MLTFTLTDHGGIFRVRSPESIIGWTPEKRKKTNTILYLSNSHKIAVTEDSETVTKMIEEAKNGTDQD